MLPPFTLKPAVQRIRAYIILILILILVFVFVIFGLDIEYHLSVSR